MFSRTPKGKAFSFGISFQAYERVYSKNNKSPDRCTPGPGTYNLPQSVGKDGLHYTLKPRLNTSQLRLSKDMPGPGTYETPTTTSKTGNYFNSKFRNSKAKVFDPSRSKRFSDYPKNALKGSPGPGTYNPKTEISRNGDYFVTQYKSSLCRTFYHYNRDTMPVNNQKKTIPGPGMYRLPSDFGYCDKKPGKPKRRARSVEEPTRIVK